MLLSTLAFAQSADDAAHAAPAGDHAAPAGEHAAPAGDHAAPSGEHAASAGDHAAPAAGHEAAGAHEVAGDHGSGPDMQLLTLQAINFTIFFVVLFIFARKPIMNALGNRASAVRRDLDESAKLRDEAEARYHEIEKKLAGLDQRIEQMKAEAAAEAAAEQARIGERAEADAVRIKETAERTIREEALRARNEIRKEVVEQASALAVGMVKQSVTVEDQLRLQGELLTSLKRPNSPAAKPNGGGEA